MRIIKLSTKAALTIIGVFAISLTGLSASSADSTSQQYPVSSSSSVVADTCEDLSGSHESPEIVDKPEAIEAARGSLGELEGNPEIGEPQVSQTDESLVVAWPLKSNGFDEGSSFSVALSPGDYEVVSTGQSKIENIDESSVKLTVWTNGEIQSQEIVEATDDEINAASANSSTVNCIISATGLAPATALAIVSACSAGCIVSAGAACAVCVGMFTALGSASIMSCFGQAS